MMQVSGCSETFLPNNTTSCSRKRVGRLMIKTSDFLDALSFFWYAEHLGSKILPCLPNVVTPNHSLILCTIRYKVSVVQKRYGFKHTPSHKWAHVMSVRATVLHIILKIVYIYWVEHTALNIVSEGIVFPSKCIVVLLSHKIFTAVNIQIAILGYNTV
jgi:hypothetical protein